VRLTRALAAKGFLPELSNLNAAGHGDCCLYGAFVLKTTVETATVHMAVGNSIFTKTTSFAVEAKRKASRAGWPKHERHYNEQYSRWRPFYN
jgi:hypothetical protein